ncbi:MAG: transcription termination/antitermination protein NusA [Lentisphaerae bacterium]|nr:transcription termination/antitermination protein NusA [Lentisphaerota bacterium]
MNNELLTILNFMERERGIDRETLIEAVEYALQSASRRSIESEMEPRIEVDRKTCDIRAFAPMTVVEKPRKGKNEITLQQAHKTDPNAQLGDTVETEVTPRNLGRIAAQTAKQAIIQRIRQAERDIVFEEYKDRVGDIVTGAVRQFNRSDIVVDLGRAEALLPAGERVPTEEYQIGDRIRGFILKVEPSTTAPSVILSRSHPDFVRKLFQLEVSEIADGIVEIKGIAREPGYRTKIAVVSHDEKVDPVGACVGMRGIRVKNIVRELSGEKIDIIRWSDDVRTYVTNALSPAKLLKVDVDEEIPNLVHIMTEADQLSLAIGKRGQNVRLTAKLLGLKIDIHKDEREISFEEKVANAINRLAMIESISQAQAEVLVKSGFLSVEGILAVDVAELAETTGFDLETARAVHEAAAGLHGEPEADPGV